MSDIFISYKRERDGSSPFVEHLEKALHAKGYDVWYDTDIRGGRHWRRSILNAIFRCEVFIVILSEEALKSQWIDIECNIAYSLGKTILPVLIDVEASEIPEYLRDRQAVQHGLGFFKTYDDVAKAVEKLHPYPNQNAFWYHLFESGIDIYVPLERFQEYHGVNIFSFKSSLDLQERLLKKYYPYFVNPDAIRIETIDDRGGGLVTYRNRIIIGGPGGVPYVHEILKQWSGNKSNAAFSGYRYVVREQIAGSGPFLRAVGENESYCIVDVQNNEEIEIFTVEKPDNYLSGVNYGVVYTGNFEASSAPDDTKTIILSAFSRAVLPGMIDFLINDTVRSQWIEEIRQCGKYTETLLRFRTSASGVDLSNVYRPRSLGQ